MKLYLVTFLITALLLGCDSNTNQGEIAYFGGEIINPNNNYVTLYCNETERDTIYLDENNRFIHKIENLNTGLYSFTHGGEYQTLLIEPNDSILFRLNTADFDESLVYTGQGSKKNNYFIKSYLTDEIESKKFEKKRHLEPEAFETVIKSLREQKIDMLGHFTTAHETSELFKKIALASINYNYYTYKELYPFGYFGNNKLIHVKDLPEDFYDYRKDVNFNDETLSGLYSYNRFLLWHFQNIGLQKYYEDGSHHAFDRHALDYNLEKLNLIDSIIENKTIKNYVLMYVTREFIFNSNNAEKSKSMLAAFTNKSTDKANTEYLTNLVSATINLFPGNKIPSIKIVDFNNNTKDLHTIITKPTVIYCWSSNFKMSYRNNHYMMRSLKSNYPDMNFIAININDMNTESWKQTLNLLKYPTENEYMFKNPNEAIKTFAIAYSQKVIIVDKNGKIIKSNADLFSNDISYQIETALASNNHKKTLK
ncbi:TlpA family protein disulfide reductase [Psychroserpens sp. MEBiC05023]